MIVYGDFAVSPGPERRGGPPTDRVLEPGDMFILDFSVVIAGYRSDFTNTLVVGREPTADQQRLYDLCMPGDGGRREGTARGAACLTVYEAVRGVFERAGVAEHFPHHAGHGLGLTHPEAPYFVRHADETLLAGDVVTLEPGLYVPGVGGIRIEHNYLITTPGCEPQQPHHCSAVTGPAGRGCGLLLTCFPRRGTLPKLFSVSQAKEGPVMFYQTEAKPQGCVLSPSLTTAPNS